MLFGFCDPITGCGTLLIAGMAAVGYGAYQIGKVAIDTFSPRAGKAIGDKAAETFEKALGHNPSDSRDR